MIEVILILDPDEDNPAVLEAQRELKQT